MLWIYQTKCVAKGNPLVHTREFDMEIQLTCLIYFTVFRMFPPTIDSGLAGSLLRLFDFSIWDKAISAFSHSSDASRVPSCTCLWSCILQHWHSDALFRTWPFQQTCSSILLDHKRYHWPTVTKSMKNEHACLSAFVHLSALCKLDLARLPLSTLYCKYPWRGSHLAFVVHLLLKMTHVGYLWMFAKTHRYPFDLQVRLPFPCRLPTGKSARQLHLWPRTCSFWQTSIKQSKL